MVEGELLLRATDASSASPATVDGEQEVGEGPRGERRRVELIVVLSGGGGPAERPLRGGRCGDAVVAILLHRFIFFLEIFFF